MTHNTYYILNSDGSTSPCTLDEWMEYRVWNGTPTIGREVFNVKSTKEVLVSTVFLGMNHAFRDDVPPVLFETMVFGGQHDEYMNRYCTIDEARQGHRVACAHAKTHISVSLGGETE